MNVKENSEVKDTRSKRTLVLGTLDSIRFNVMVAGVGGIGKTTFLKLFFQLYRRSGSPVALHLPQPKTVKTLKIEEIGRCVLDAGNVQVDFHLIDTPGFGDSINNQHAINNVKRYIERAHQEWSAMDIRSMSRQVSSVVLECCASVISILGNECSRRTYSLHLLLHSCSSNESD